MNGGTLQLAMRDLRRHLAQPAVLAGLLAVAAILGLSGPFDTLAGMQLAERLLYWALVTGLTYGAGFMIGHLARPVIAGWPAPVRVAVRALVVCSAVVVILLGLAVLFGRLPDRMDPGAGLRSVASVYAVCLVIDALGEVLDRQPGGPTASRPAAPTQPALLLRLSADRRGPLVAIRAEDHYVHVTTTRGRQMVLLRLADAIAEAAPTPGLRVHRSHWVALDQVHRARRQRDGAVLTMSDKAQVPVSRSAMPDLRAAGLIIGPGG